MPSGARVESNTLCCASSTKGLSACLPSAINCSDTTISSSVFPKLNPRVGVGKGAANELDALDELDAAEEFDELDELLLEELEDAEEVVLELAELAVELDDDNDDDSDDDCDDEATPVTLPLELLPPPQPPRASKANEMMLIVCTLLTVAP